MLYNSRVTCVTSIILNVVVCMDAVRDAVRMECRLFQNIRGRLRIYSQTSPNIFAGVHEIFADVSRNIRRGPRNIRRASTKYSQTSTKYSQGSTKYSQGSSNIFDEVVEICHGLSLLL